LKKLIKKKPQGGTLPRRPDLQNNGARSSEKRVFQKKSKGLTVEKKSKKIANEETVF